MLVHRPCEPGERINENWPLDPKLPYRASKVETKALLRAEHGRIPIAILRPAGIYNAFLANQIARIYEGSFQGRLYPGDLER